MATLTTADPVIYQGDRFTGLIILQPYLSFAEREVSGEYIFVYITVYDGIVKNLWKGASYRAFSEKLVAPFDLSAIAVAVAYWVTWYRGNPIDLLTNVAFTRVGVCAERSQYAVLPNGPIEVDAIDDYVTEVPEPDSSIIAQPPSFTVTAVRHPAKEGAIAPSFEVVSVRHPLRQ